MVRSIFTLATIVVIWSKKMVKIFLLPFILIFSLSTFASTQLENYCDQYKGEVVQSYKCPKSGLTIPFDFCVIKRESKVDLFFDGCTGPTGGHSALFYPYCIAHDFCYHQEPATSGKTQKMCDMELREGLLKACQKATNIKKCKNWAKTMYRAVRMFGALAYNCADIKE